MFRFLARITIIGLIAFVFNGCAATKDYSKPEDLKPDALLVGVTPDYPPIIFKQGSKIVGVEADFARRLAKELDRPLRFIEMQWQELIPALLEGKTDIIMAGMSVTEARKSRINFTDHYVRSGLLALIRVEDAPKFDSLRAIMQSSSVVGVVEGTTGHAFVKRNFPNAKNVIGFSKASDCVFELKERRTVDVFVHDIPSIVWLISENEADLAGFWEPLNEEYLAWGVRTDDQEFLMQVNDILRNWKKDGTLERILSKWLPYLQKIKNPTNEIKTQETK